jgi:hypothetical protein
MSVGYPPLVNALYTPFCGLSPSPIRPFGRAQDRLCPGQGLDA